jgi:formylmethanofuran dehydrogenase subunit E
MNFDKELEKAKSFHGHTCPGIVLGTRIAIAGNRRLGIEDPSKTRDLIVYVEIDRCLADAIQAITLCSLGKRRLKHVDYGKFAATFVDTSKNKAVRISVKEGARDWSMKHGEKRGLVNKGKPVDRKQAISVMIEAYMKIPDRDLLNIQDVSVSIPKYDIPGLPQRKVTCVVCGERIFDGREKRENGRILCRSCAGGAYYKNLNET